MNNINLINQQTGYTIVCGQEQLKLFNKISELRKKVWPDFIRLSDDVIFKLYELYPEFQISLLDRNNELIAIANAAPILWTKSLTELSDEGVTWIIHTSLNQK